MVTIPTLQAERLVLRPFTLEDAPPVEALLASRAAGQIPVSMWEDRSMNAHLD